jgi:TonB family protein
MKMRRDSINTRDDEALRALLLKWGVPRVSSDFDGRVISSFRFITHTKSVLPNHVSLQQKEVIAMKHCPTCKETFSSMFVFCPIDSALLIDETEPQFDFEIGENEILVVPSSGAYHLTMMNDAGLVRRLVTEIRATAEQSRLTFPEFKRDPLGFLKRTASVYGLAFRRFITAPNVAIAIVVALIFIMTTVVLIAMFDRYSSDLLAQQNEGDAPKIETIIDLPKNEEQEKDGAAGMSEGKGGGSGDKEKPGGGGGGGREEEKPPSNGKTPMAIDNPPLKTPEVIPPPPTKKPLVVKPTIQGDQVLMPEDMRPIPYGVDHSTATDPSNGTGTGDGQGTGKGAGNGEGNGNGKGPGNKENTGGNDPSRGKDGPGGPGSNINYDKVFKQPEVQIKARITFNPQPQYTEEARKNQTQGVVRISMVLNASGQVQSIRVINGLPDGLTEKALEAARRIKFIPAQKDGRNVSQYATVEYSFRIY